MIKILIVEDEQEKRRMLIETLLEVEGVSLEQIKYVDDVLSAKREIAAWRFDMLILDINVPSRPDRQTEIGAGLDVISYVRNNKNAKRPACIIGMTAAAAEEVFSSPLWKLVRFSYSELAWQTPLKEAVRYLISARRPPFANDGQSYHIDLGIVVALEEEELKSVMDLDASWQEIPVENDHSRYFSGTFSEGERKISVVAVAAPKMGMPAAAVTASKLIHSFRPRLLAMSGICAGVRGKVGVGDILIADPCFDWDSGKWLREKPKAELKFRPAPYPWRLDEGLRGVVKRLDREQWLKDLCRNFEGKQIADRPPKIIVEAMASGASVLQAASLMDDVKDQHKNLVGVEMESYAVFTAAEYAAEPRPKCISIKSVCDFGDEDKEDGAHAYAAYTSAQFLYQFALAALGDDPIGA